MMSAPQRRKSPECWATTRNRRWNRMLLLCLICCCWSVKSFTILKLHTATRIRTPISLSMAASVVDEKKTTTTVTHKPTTKKRRHHHHPRNRNQKYKNTRRRIRDMFMKAKTMERQGQWLEACLLYNDILKLDKKDAHSHLGLARLEARRNQDETKARQVFERGTKECPSSVHLWQAWALYEEKCGNVDRARELFQQALSLEPNNPYVCHACGLMERKLGNTKLAKELWECALNQTSTAALVCSLGELLIANRQYNRARELYLQHLLKLESERERSEVYLAAAWLEEKYAHNVDKAEELIRLALLQSPSESRAHVALARLEGRRNNNTSSKEATVRRLANACISMEHENSAKVTDGRLYNAWAHLEVTSGRLPAARKILRKGMEKFPNDQSLFQAAGKVEERIGNFTGARELYVQSLSIEPSAPTLVAYAMLELQQTKPVNYTRVQRFFEEALLLDPRHGPAYNAFGNMELRRGNVDGARKVFERGLKAQCMDVASVYHGLAKLELSQGNVDVAREVLIKGLRQMETKERVMDTFHLDRAMFLAHSLGMLELNSNHVAEAMNVFQDGIARYGASSQLLLGAALCEVKLGKEDSARHLFERSVQVDSRHAQAWQAWGVMEMRAANITTAKTLFETGLKSVPNHGALWQAYANMEGRLGNLEKARKLFASGIKKCPRHVPLYQGWASLELRAGNLTTARRLISEALTRDKRQGSGWLVAAQIEERQGHDGMVGLVLRRGIECAPNEAALYCALGDHLVDKGKFQDARQILERGLDINPLHAPLYHSLAELEARLFNVDGLAELNKRAATIFNNNALVSPPSSSNAFGKKIRMGRNTTVPDGVAALAQKVGESLEAEDTTDLEPRSTFESMSQLEDEVVKDLFQDDTFSDCDDTGTQ